MAKRKKNRKAVLVTSCILAAMIVAGSTFAWFTSKDEVTNRLSASADYGVAIAEDFTPPENLLPGQVVNKDVSVVNTGNVDALVKVHLEGAMNILRENAVASEVDVLAPGFTAPITEVNDSNLTKLGLTLKDNNGNYFRTLSKGERANPNLAGTGDNSNADDDNYSEVKSVQAGGYLAYAGGDFKFTPESAGYTYTNTTNNVVTQTAPTELESTSIKNTWNTGVGLEIDADTFLPTSSGLFIFRRDVTESNVTGSEGTYYEYSGYYYKAADSDTGGQGTYYALHYLPNEGGTTYKSDFVIYSTKENAEVSGNALTVTYETTNDKKTPVVSVVGSSVKLFSASYTRVEGLTGSYDAGTKSGDTVTVPPTVTFTNGSGNAMIKVTVNLDKVGVKAPAASNEAWTELTNSGVATFYYNNDVEEGDSTAKLVDSVKLADETKKSAYLAMDFDLNVVLDSVQVTVDEDGKEDIAAAKSEWSEIAKNGTAATLNGSEISSIVWTNTDA